MEQNKPQILITGSHGLVGSKFTEIYHQQYELIGLDRSDSQDPVDITNLEQVKSKLAKYPQAKYVLHLAAYTDVTGAWKQKDDRQGAAYQVNVEGTRNLVASCQEMGKHLVHISTAYVFDGQKDGLYVEEDQPQPIEWYGQTKLWAEEVVQDSQAESTILRIDQPFRNDAVAKLDVVHRIIKGLKEDNLYPQFSDHFFGPTYINDFVKVMEWVVRTGTTGLFHATSGEQWTDYDLAQAVKETLNLPGQVQEGQLSEYLKTLNRPYQQNTALDNSKLTSVLDFELKNIRQALAQVEVS